MGESDINAVNAILDIHTHKGEEQSGGRRLSINRQLAERQLQRDIIILSAFILGN